MSIAKDQDGFFYWKCDKCGEKAGWQPLVSTECAEYELYTKKTWFGLGREVTIKRQLPKIHVCQDCVVSMVMKGG